ncbi:MAG: hypothetical protein JWN80_1002 [Microbacteriaceae bacterium]|jgi:hypothetical protein|nr:hypothetical protein [Microbacteriaceae bacterium]
MKRFALFTTILTAVLVLVLPFIGGGGPALQGSLTSAATADETGLPIFATTPSSNSSSFSATDAGLAAVHQSDAETAAASAAATSATTTDTEHLAQKPVPVPVVLDPTTAANLTPSQRAAARAAAGQSCPSGAGGGGSAPGGSDGKGVSGTTSSDIQSFSAQFNAIRVANCLDPIPSSNFRYDSCMEQRLYWMAEDPSEDPGNTWGHAGVQSLAPGPDGQLYSSEVPEFGCDGNLAGGSGNDGATVAQKWWDSLPHRLALYKPSYTGSTAGVCIYFAMTHGGVPDEPSSFTRAAARWASC